MHVAVDLATPQGPARAIEEAERVFGGLDVVVNNVGGPPAGAVLPRFSFTELTDAGWAAMLDFNLMSTVRAVRVAIPLLLERGGGAIVNVTSTHALVASGVNVDYGAAKAAVGNLTQALSEEFGPRGLRRRDRQRPRDRFEPEGGRGDAFDHRSAHRSAGSRRRHRAAVLTTLGEHHGIGGPRRRGSLQDRLNCANPTLAGPGLPSAELAPGALHAC
ncbi:SDR family oxidoreductase [Nocardia zapadnayensis]|uniref:SDR family NAD(P)-dependent oxidoreductase n=1 Tax=Nocardia rhamnosiphila TaxID=426716 RepID=UPI00224605F0|nr:SDR family oxidoreductase [Nocardia zapadnayensis]MCX0269175.1 SDR family oxidoreductase [Nocardia zapadnayensis]